MMERMISVEVVVRDQVDPIARGLVPELIESFLDFSTSWTVQKAACSGYLSLLKRLGERNAEITDHGMDCELADFRPRTANHMVGATVGNIIRKQPGGQAMLTLSKEDIVFSVSIDRFQLPPA
ncbi:unnamed protein product [Peronospora farinosa]|uniref:Uncharacterized protein n=1 Tax=Peronospora farinosa TaxID=134698 RepID=A0ABN8C9K4_9STRA|nr:unnamed protein product [Peronospora farinosa]